MGKFQLWSFSVNVVLQRSILPNYHHHQVIGNGTARRHRRKTVFTFHKERTFNVFKKLSTVFFEAQTSVPRASNKLGEWVRDFSPWASLATDAAKETQFGTPIMGEDWWWCPNFEYTHSPEKVRDTTRDDEKLSQHDMRCSDGAL